MRRRSFVKAVGRIAGGIASGMVALAVGGFASPAHARDAIDTGATPTISVSAGDVDVLVEGWAKREVEVVESDLGSGWKVILDKTGSKISVRFDGVGIPSHGKIKLRVPKASNLSISARSGDIGTSAQTGHARVTTVSGHVTLRGSPSRVDVRTTSGDVRLSGLVGEAEITTVSGDIDVDTASGKLRTKSVSGNVRVATSRLDRLVVASVSGAVSFIGSLNDGRHEIDSHSGAVSVSLPKKAEFTFRARSFSGSIEDRRLEPPVVTKSRYERIEGDGGPELDVSSFSGKIEFLAD